MRLVVVLIPAAGLLFAGGCNRNAKFLTEDRLQNGLVIILPGIEGESPLNRDIRRGLVSAGVYRAMPIYSWGRPIPLAGVLLNQMDIIGNRIAGAKIAKWIVQYQDSHPRRSVYIVGHSGGGGVAVFAAEAMPDGRQIDGLILLSASISSAYDLTKALGKCRAGIVNFYSKADVGFLVIGTIVAGNVDGRHGPAAGAVGFDKPNSKDGGQKMLAYNKLFQVEMTRAMTGSIRAHTAATGVGFVSKYVSRWILASSWPPSAAARRDGDSELPAAALASSQR